MKSKKSKIAKDIEDCLLDCDFKREYFKKHNALKESNKLAKYKRNVLAMEHEKDFVKENSKNVGSIM